MLETVKQTIEKHKLLTKGDKVLVAVSGGADSVCLLHILCALSKEYGFSVSAAHVNHGLRGQEADRDEAFTKDFCEKLSVPFFVLHADVKKRAEEKGAGLEETGRIVRYEFFYNILEQEGFTKIATAHHRDDNVETVLMRLLRGTGPVGLGGIPYRNGAVIRPLLDVSRADVENYLVKQGLTYCTDSTNGETTFTRNRIRHELLPMIEQSFNPNFKENFAEQIATYAACAAFVKEQVSVLYNQLAETAEYGVSFSCEALKQENGFLVSELIRHTISTLMQGRLTSMAVISAICDIVAKKQGSVSVSEDWVAEICHEKLYLRQKEQAVSFFFPVLYNEVMNAETGDRFLFNYGESVPDEIPQNILYLDAEKLKGKSLYIRSRKNGDVFYPVGMEGRKTIQDFFVDQKIPHFLRDSVPLLVADEDIIWVAGMRADKRYLAPKGDKNALRVIYYGGTKR